MLFKLLRYFHSKASPKILNINFHFSKLMEPEAPKKFVRRDRLIELEKSA